MSFIENAAAKALAKGLNQQEIQKIADQKAKAAFVLLIIACGMWYFVQTPFAALPLLASIFVGGHAFFKSEVSSKMIDLSMKSGS